MILVFLILFLFLTEGKGHDSAVSRMSGLMTRLEESCFDKEGAPLCIYWDSAYPHRVQLQTGYKHNDLFNMNMNRLRTSVEFTFTEFEKNLKIGLSLVGTKYRVAVLMHNAMNCLY